MGVTDREIYKIKKMKRNSVIFGVLCGLMVLTMVSSTLVGGEMETTRLYTA